MRSYAGDSEETLRARGCPPGVPSPEGARVSARRQIPRRRLAPAAAARPRRRAVRRHRPDPGHGPPGGDLRAHGRLRADLDGPDRRLARRTASGNHHHGDSETAIYVVSGHPVFVFAEGEQEVRLDPRAGRLRVRAAVHAAPRGEPDRGGRRRGASPAAARRRSWSTCPRSPRTRSSPGSPQALVAPAPAPASIIATSPAPARPSSLSVSSVRRHRGVTAAAQPEKHRPEEAQHRGHAEGQVQAVPERSGDQVREEPAAGQVGVVRGETCAAAADGQQLLDRVEAEERGEQRADRRQAARSRAPARRARPGR